MANFTTTLRAYTLKLSGRDNWRDVLWNTHCTVNRGVRVWGNWLLTLRGGLPASLADDAKVLPVTEKEVAAKLKRRKPNGAQAEDEVRRILENQRLDGLRVVLALSWLSVESPASFVPQEHIVARGTETTEERRRNVTKRFQEILERLDIQGRDEWTSACEPALTARIRDDAVWVDRSAAFLQFARNHAGLSQDWAAAALSKLIGGMNEYFSIPDTEAAVSTEAKDFIIKAGNWLSTHWGAGEKSDACAIGNNLIRLASVNDSNVCGKPGSDAIAVLLTAVSENGADETDAARRFKKLKQAVGWKGRPSKGAMALQKLVDAAEVTSELWTAVGVKLREEAADQHEKASRSTEVPAWIADFRSNVEEQIGLPFRVQRDNIWEYAVMLDHALRRISAGHTWIKRAEAQRRQFQQDAAKIDDADSVPVAARQWLDKYCSERSAASGVVEDNLIRKRAVEGWEKIVRLWSCKDCKSQQDRIDKARELQADPEINKFGDIQLFEALADDKSVCVWQNEKDKPDSAILRNYVDARVAENDQRRFKVPAYRHPDPLRHPVFVDFGNSRWSITYSALRAVQDREKTRKKLAKAKSEKTREELQKQLVEPPDLHGVTLTLWNGEAVEPHPLRWHGKRLRKDLDFNHFEDNGTDVSRADRLGRSVVGEPKAAVSIAEVFDQDGWNGRLQVPRVELDRLADLVYGKNTAPDERQLDQIDEKARRLWERLSWFLSFSAKLQPAGPWLDYAQSLPDGWKYKKGRNGYYLAIEANKDRKGRARLKLARLPGLRVLSVDLGHRYAAACTVWESLAAETFFAEIKEGEIVSGGTGPDDLYAHVRRVGNDGKQRTTIYRRIGANVIPDGKPHPAPWARLDRQFFIKLQGEDRTARRARSEEFQVFQDLCESLGKKTEQPRERLELHGATTIYPRIDELMREAVNVARLGLRRHGNSARIAYALTSCEKPISGGRTITMNREQRIEALQDALVLWQELASSTDYRDEWARERWNEWIIDEFDGPQLAEIVKDVTWLERKRKIEELRRPLEAVAQRLIDRDNSDLHKLWVDEWESRTRTFQQLLRRLRKIILPRIGNRPLGDSPQFKRWKQKARELRNVGGLTYTRLATVRGLYQVMRAFHSRPEPHNLRAGTEHVEREAESGNRFGLRVLRTFDRLRENRVKQLASRIVEAALGVGSEDCKHWERGRKRPRIRIDNPRFAPCHAVIVEDLEHYRPDEKRPRRENHQLMAWAARNVRKYLMEGCELCGLHFDEVDPRYTSRQDSRTGLPGFRCGDVSIVEYMRSGGYFQNDVKRASMRLEKGGTDSRDRLLVELSERFSDVDEDTLRAAKPLRILRTSGEVFVSANEESNPATAIQADLNAAANIGLKALLDSDWAGAWWYVPVKAGDGKPIAEKLKGCAAIDADVALAEAQTTPGNKEIVNLWSDLSSAKTPTQDWRSYAEYWNNVRWRVIQSLRLYNGLKNTDGNC